MKSWLRAAITSTAATALAFTLASALTGCANPNAQPTNQAFVPHIAVILGTESPSYAATVKAAAESAAKEFGAILEWHDEALNGTAKRQQSLVYWAAKGNVQGIILMPIDATLQPYVDLAAGLGSDVVNFDSHVPTLDKVFANIYDDANTGGIKLADAIANSIGYKKGNAYEIALGVVNPDDQVTKVRLAGFNYELDAKYPGIKVVATAISHNKSGKASSQVASVFTKNPKLAGFVAMDSFTATAAAALVQNRKLSVPLVAYDAEPDHVALLKKGVFKDLISQNPAQKIRLAIQQIATHQLTGAMPQYRDQMFGNVILDASSSKADLKKYSYLPAK